MAEATRTGDFHYFRLRDGLDLYVHPSDRFKTVTAQAFLHEELGPNATALALLSMVLRRGTRAHPSMREITRFLEGLYGASVDGDATKRGENHVLFFRATFPAPAYVDEGEDVLWEGIRFLGSLLSDPRLDAGTFPRDVVDQETRNLARLIRSLINHREHYASERLIRVMCGGERYAHYEYGNLETLAKITVEDLTEYWHRSISSRPLNVFVVGDVRPAAVAREVERAFGWDRGAIQAPPPTLRGDGPTEPKFVEEEFPLEQELFLQGYRCTADLSSGDFPALLYFNGLLGGFAFSRLFKTVREREGLVYDISSHVDRHKGLMFVSAGVKPGRSDRVRLLVEEIIGEIRGGSISEEEMDSARKRMVGEIRALPDAPSQFIHAAEEGILAGKLVSLREMEDRMTAVTKEDVARIASHVTLDTTYLLKPMSSTGGNRGMQP
ncbi:MAG: EF-P 5-aminopentanol modification-associated protein YfmF [Planctomycetota bacterium]|jgi:predicted Zn-dependent peptidase